MSTTPLSSVPTQGYAAISGTQPASAWGAEAQALNFPAAATASAPQDESKVQTYQAPAPITVWDTADGVELPPQLASAEMQGVMREYRELSALSRSLHGMLKAAGEGTPVSQQLKALGPEKLARLGLEWGRAAQGPIGFRLPGSSVNLSENELLTHVAESFARFNSSWSQKAADVMSPMLSTLGDQAKTPELQTFYLSMFNLFAKLNEVQGQANQLAYTSRQLELRTDAAAAKREALSNCLIQARGFELAYKGMSMNEQHLQQVQQDLDAGQPLEQALSRLTPLELYTIGLKIEPGSDGKPQVLAAETGKPVSPAEIGPLIAGRRRRMQTNLHELRQQESELRRQIETQLGELKLLQADISALSADIERQQAALASSEQDLTRLWGAYAERRSQVEAQLSPEDRKLLDWFEDELRQQTKATATQSEAARRQAGQALASAARELAAIPGLESEIQHLLAGLNLTLSRVDGSLKALDKLLWQLKPQSIRPSLRQLRSALADWKPATGTPMQPLRRDLLKLCDALLATQRQSQHETEDLKLRQLRDQLIEAGWTRQQLSERRERDNYHEQKLAELATETSEQLSAWLTN